MKNKKLFIIIAAAVVLLAVAAAAVIFFGGEKPEDKDDENKAYVNLIDQYATGDIKNYILTPERASEAGDSYVKTEAPLKAYEKFTLTEDESTKMKDIVAGDKWHLMSSAEFSDPAAKAHWKNIFAYSGLDLSYNAETTYYLVRTSDARFVSTSDFMPASSCEIVIFDTEDNSYYYIRFDN